MVGHRFVHGGTRFITPTIIQEKHLKELEKYNDLAPLHNPYCLQILELAREYFSKIPHLAVFDTQYFSQMPEKAKVYPLPFDLYEKYNIQKFGFHGISHKYVAERAAQILKKDLNKINLITCHLGGGCSITAIKKGKPIDTSMGFTPLEGLMMMTRSGDIDPCLILYLKKRFNFTDEKIYEILNYKSGIKGVFGKKDFLELLEEMEKENKKAKLAFNMFVYRIQKYIGAYLAILGNIDAVVFTGRIGAGNPVTRKSICQDIYFLKKIKVMSIQSNEEMAIAKECLKVN